MKCRLCGTELVKDEVRNCMYCEVCHPPRIEPEPEPEKEKKLLDVQMTEERVREIIRDELENWHIPSNTHFEGTAEDLINKLETLKPKPENSIDKNWRSMAKELEIPLAKPTGGARKKVDVVEDIKSRLAEQTKPPE
jgi:hypothetical protein